MCCPEQIKRLCLLQIIWSGLPVNGSVEKGGLFFGLHSHSIVFRGKRNMKGKNIHESQVFVRDSLSALRHIHKELNCA